MRIIGLDIGSRTVKRVILEGGRPVGHRVLEGYIDLLVRTEEGLVIVDYKTDQWSGPVQTAERIGRYRTQLAAYGAALEVTLDEPVVGGVLVRCRADSEPEQIDIPDWTAALDEVRAIVGGGPAGSPAGSGVDEI